MMSDNLPTQNSDGNTVNSVCGGVRESLRCGKCKLVQFVSKAKQCVRCHEPYPGPPVAVPEPVVVPEPVKDPSAPLRMFKSPSDWFPVVLAAIRVMQGKSKVQIALQMKVNRTYICKLEKHNVPNIGSLEKVAAAYDTALPQICRMGEFLYSGQ